MGIPRCGSTAGGRRRRRSVSACIPGPAPSCASPAGTNLGRDDRFGRRAGIYLWSCAPNMFGTPPRPRWRSPDAGVWRPGRRGASGLWRAGVPRRPRGAQQCEVWRTGALVHVGAGIRDARSGVHPPSIAHPGVWPSWPRPLMVPGCDVCPHATAGRGSERVERVSRRWRAPACPARGRCQRVTRQGDPLRRARWLQNLLRVVSACFDANFSGCVLSCLLVVRACRRASPVTRFGSRRPAWGH